MKWILKSIQQLNIVNELIFVNKIERIDQADYDANINDIQTLVANNITSSNFYNQSSNRSLENLDLRIGGNQVSRFSCSEHKLNVALRHAFDLHQDFKSLLGLLI